MNLIGANGPILYVDTSTVIYYANCFSQLGNEVYAQGITCSNWNYGRTILKVVNFLPQSLVDTVLIGRFFTYSVLATFIYFLNLLKQYKHAQILMFFGLISPSVWLLMERANFDCLIYLMVFLSVLFFRKGFELTAIGLIVCTALFKFYTLPVLIILLFFTNKLPTKVSSFIGFTLATYIILADFSLMGGMSMQAGNNHFGMKIIANYLGKLGLKLSNFEAYLLGSILFIATITLVFFIISKNEPKLFGNVFVPESLKSFFRFMSSIFLIAFSIGLSVDYRLIFYLVSAPILITLLESRIIYLYSVSFIIGAWFCYPVGFFQTFGDLNLEFIASFQLLVLIMNTFAKKTSRAHQNH